MKSHNWVFSINLNPKLLYTVFLEDSVQNPLRIGERKTVLLNTMVRRPEPHHRHIIICSDSFFIILISVGCY